MSVTDPATGIQRSAEVFIPVMGASNMTYAEASWSQALPDWICAHARAFVGGRGPGHPAVRKTFLQRTYFATVGGVRKTTPLNISYRWYDMICKRRPLFVH